MVTFAAIVIAIVVTAVVLVTMNNNKSSSSSIEPKTDQIYFSSSAELTVAVDTYMDELSLPESNRSLLRYGNSTGSWCVSGIQNFSYLFSGDRNLAMRSFNENISSWDVSSALYGSEIQSRSQQVEHRPVAIDGRHVPSSHGIRRRYLLLEHFQRHRHVTLFLWSICVLRRVVELGHF